MDAILQPSLPGVTKLFKQSFFFYKQHFSVLAGIAAIPFLLGLIQILAGKNLPIGPVVILTILTFIVGFLSQLALLDIVVVAGRSIGGAYKKSLRMFFPFIWITGLVALATMGGIFLFIIPGVLLSIWLSFSVYALFAENRRGMAALVTSWHYVKGYWGAIFGRFFVLGLILIGISLPVILASLKSGVKPEISLTGQLVNLFLARFIILPFSVIYSYGIYKSLKEIKGSVPLETDGQKIKRNIIIFSAIGIIGLVGVIIVFGLLLVKVLPRLFT